MHIGREIKIVEDFYFDIWSHAITVLFVTFQVTEMKDVKIYVNTKSQNLRQQMLW